MDSEVITPLLFPVTQALDLSPLRTKMWSKKCARSTSTRSTTKWLVCERKTTNSVAVTIKHWRTVLMRSDCVLYL